MSNVYQKIISAKKRGRAQLAVLIDPDKFNPELIRLCNKYPVSYFFVGGSLLKSGSIEKTIVAIKKLSRIPVIIFPGDEKQLCSKADAVLFLSLLSGRNPDYLIGKQVIAAPIIKRKKLECISTAYILAGGNRKSATQEVTRTQPLVSPQKITATALAGEMLGFKLIYLEAGSGAKSAISKKLISLVKSEVSVPLIVGGGITSANKALLAVNSGADIVVVGNALEKNMDLIKSLSSLFV